MIWVYWDIFGPKKHTRKIDKVHKVQILNYIKPSCIIFCVRMFKCSHDIYSLQEESTQSGLRV